MFASLSHSGSENRWPRGSSPRGRAAEALEAEVHVEIRMLNMTRNSIQLNLTQIESPKSGSRLQVVSRRPPQSQREPPRVAEPAASDPAPPFTAFSRRPPQSQRDPPRAAEPASTSPFTAFSAVPNARNPASFSSPDAGGDKDDNIEVPPSNFGSRGTALRCAIHQPRERPNMMSALEGGGGSWRSGCTKGGCMNSIV